MSRGYGLTDSEKKEVNKNTRAAQQSLMHKRRNIKSVAKNNLAGLGGAALGAGLGYGALKGAVGMAGARSAIKGAKLSRKLNKQKVFNSIEEYKDMVALADAYKTKAKLKKDTAQLVAKISNSPTVAGALGGMTGGIAGNMLRDRSEVKKFMKERYGDNYKPTIKQNEVDRVLAKREKSAFDIVNDSFEKVAKLSQEELAWQAIDIMNSDDDRRMDDDQFEALQAMRRINPNFGDDGLSNIERNLISSLNTNKPIKYNNLKFKHVANDWVKDGNIKNTPFTNYNKHDVVFGWNDRVHTKDKHKFGTSYVLKSPTKDKYYLAQYDNDVPEGYDLSRINDNMKVLQLSQGATNRIKEKGFIK